MPNDKRAALTALLKDAERAETTVPLCLKPKLERAYRDLERDLQAARAARGDMLVKDDVTTRAIAMQMQEIADEMAEATYEFTLRAVNKQQWTRLLKAHPDPGEKLAYDVDALMLAVIRACLVDPDLDDEEWAQLIGLTYTPPDGDPVEFPGLLGPGSYNRLSNAAWALNTGDVQVPTSRLASEALRNSEPTSS